MVITIFGSRNLFGPAVKEIIDNEVKRLNPDYVATAGDADGVCKEARNYCRDKAIPLKLHYLNKKYARGMYEQRSIAVLEETDFVVFIHDGKSKGTKNEIELAKKMGIKYHYYLLKRDEIVIIDDFEIDY